MGTKLQSKSHLSGYCSIWGMNESVSNDIWSLYRQDMDLKTGQHHDSVPPQQLVMDAYLGYDKEKVKQMILDHESTFRHQVQELHRLYGRQRELMDEFKRREVKENYIKAKTLHSSTFSSNVSSDDAQHVSHTALLHSLVGRLSTSQTFSLPGFIKGKSMPGPFPSRDVGISDKYEPSNSKSNVLHARIFDLEISAGLYKNVPGKKLEENLCGLPGIESGSAMSIHEIQHDKDVKSSFGSILNNLKDDGFRSNSCLQRNSKLADLNEPILVEETSISAFVTNPALATCTLNEVQKAYTSADSNSTSSIHFAHKDVPIHSVKERDGGICFKHFQSRNERNAKEQLRIDFKSNACSKASQPEVREVDELSSTDGRKTGGQLRRKLFGVDIVEVNDESVATDTSMVSCTHKLDSESSIFKDEVDVNTRTRSTSRSKEEVANKNDLSLCSQLDTNQLKGCSRVGCNLTSHMMDKDLPSNQCRQKDILNPISGLDCLNQKSAKVLKTATDTFSMFLDDAFLSEEFQNVQNGSRGSFPRCIEMEYCAEQTGASTNSCHLNLDSLQNSCRQFFQNTKTNSVSSQILTQKQATTSPYSVQQIECGNISTDKESTMKSAFLFPILSKLSSPKAPSFAGISSKEIYLTGDGDNAGNLVVERAAFKDRSKANEMVLEERMSNSLSGLQCHFDLNLSLIEEEAPSTPSLPSSVVKVVTTEIDLEAPVILEAEVDICHETDIEVKLSSDVPKEHDEDLLRIAAEAIVALSLSGAQVTENDSTSEPLETAPENCLKWFADVVSLCKCDGRSNAADVALTADAAFTEEFIPDGLDYFEFMTLKLEDTKEENCHYNPLILENQDDEEMKVTTLSRRPRRGLARRGRQRKDFQRDILPSLITLSKHDVTEDFQTFEELLRGSGCVWPSNLVRKSATKSSRGRRRSGVMNSSLERSASCAPLEQQPVPGELQIREKTLTGWGKRTRRLPRQRCTEPSPACQL